MSCPLVKRIVKIDDDDYFSYLNVSHVQLLNRYAAIDDHDPDGDGNDDRDICSNGDSDRDGVGRQYWYWGDKWLSSTAINTIV